MDNKSSTSKKTLGRRKIQIKKIEKKSSLQVTFTKRRMGLFRKASELSVVCGSEIAILVQSPANKIFTFGNPSVESVIHRFLTGSDSSSPGGSDSTNSRIMHAEAVKKLDGEIKMEKRLLKKESVLSDEKLWWEESNLEGMQLQELEEYLEALQNLRDNVVHGLMEKLKHASSNSSSSSNNLLALTNNFNEGPNEYTNYTPQFNQQVLFDHGGMSSSVEGGIRNMEGPPVLQMMKDEAGVINNNTNCGGCSSNFVMHHPTDNINADQAFGDSYNMGNPISNFFNL